MSRNDHEPIAIIGMRGRFPGANNLDQYWKNLAEGIESIAILSREEMRASGIPDEISRLPGYVNASPVLDGVDLFDAQFFGFSARDASLTDPQHRLFLETAWEALEDAGYDSTRYPGAIGVFGGSELSTYLYNLYKNIDSLGYIDGMQLMVTNDKDHLCTQVSYRLNLRGPSVAVQTTCSTSLVALSLACESLQQLRCDMALAGGVTVRVPQRGGYFYSAGSILSPDGHCRPFDANAQGTIVGSGVGIVVLKRLADALADDDNIRAVVIGSGLNNDGNDKVGYTAPSFRGQAEAIRSAHVTAGVSAESIGYVEAHGTGTILGDPIELSALTEVFRASTKRRGFCGIGSVKSNFGHLSCAAGIAGLIKTVLAMEHEAIPPTVHYNSPNPAINLASSPFYVTTSLRRWERNGLPRRAGVSSFGVGGTNAHVVLEEAPQREHPVEKRPHQLLVISARTETALDQTTANLSTHLQAHPELDLADVAFTLQVGRRFFQHRRMLVVDSEERADTIAALADVASLGAFVANDDERPVVFTFPGQGSQYVGMAKDLYDTEPLVRKAIDDCASLLKPALKADLRRILFPGPRCRKSAAETLKDTKFAQPALFTIGYALAKLWMSWGIQPAAMIGHSVGEYVAAALAGVMTLEDALTLIARRGQLISSLPRGAMLAVMAPSEEVLRFVDDEVSLAAINAPRLCVLSGPNEPIAQVEATLAGESVVTRRLHTSHAFHSSMMDSILPEFEGHVARFKLSLPTIPFVASLTGEWADAAITQPGYWSAQLRSTVRFTDGIQKLMDGKSPAGKNAIFLEVGPGNTLTTLVSETARRDGKRPLCLTTLSGPDNRRADTETMLTSLGQFWANGVPVDWEGFHRLEHRRRVSLPSYPFERQSYWIGPSPDATAREEPARDTSNWFYKSSWQESALKDASPVSLATRRVLVLDEQMGLGTAVADRLTALGGLPITVRTGDAFERVSEDEYVINPQEPDNFTRLAEAVCSAASRLAGVIDCWTAATTTGDTELDSAVVVTLLAPMRMAHALSKQHVVRPLPILFAARGTARVLGDEILDPAKALGMGAVRVIPQEHQGLRIAHVDVDGDFTELAEELIAEFAAGVPEPSLVFRGKRRFIEAFEPVTIESIQPPKVLPENPVVMITGGLGHMGMALAEGVFEDLNARLVLIGRTPLPAPKHWAAESENPTLPPETRGLFGRLARMHAKREDVLVLNANLNDAAQVNTAVDTAIARFGAIDLVVHGAARIDAAAFAAIADTGMDVVEAQFSPKLRGLFYLIDAMKDREPRRWVLHSSISTVLGGLGLGVYAGANTVLDVLALKGGDNWLSIDWDAWDNAAEAQRAAIPTAIRPPEGRDIFLRLLGYPCEPRMLVATNLAERLAAWVRHDDAAATNGAGVKRHPRPNLVTVYIEPRSETERKLAEIWGSQLGLTSVGIQDRFFDLGGHSLLAAQVASEIGDRFQIDLPVLKLFQAPTVAELAVLVDQALAGGESHVTIDAPVANSDVPVAPDLQGDATTVAAKASYREFYNNVTRQLERSGVGGASYFLNYGYISVGEGDEAQHEVPEQVFNPSSVRLALELIGDTDLQDRAVLDVGCGRGGTVALMVERFGARATGVDLAPEAIAFCRKTHANAHFEVGDAEHLPFDDGTFDVVTNIESSHTYPNLRAFFAEVSRVLTLGGLFLYTDLLPVQRWMEVVVLLGPLGLRIVSDRDITRNVLLSCDSVAAVRAQAFGEKNSATDNFLAVPGSAVYQQMSSGAWAYRLLRAERL